VGFFNSDYQGSLIALTNETGDTVQTYAYDPWGARRNPNDWTQKDQRVKWIVSRGYTGHEHLDAFGIINMNGRVYDPLTAMLFSPDPYVQSPGNWLNYNRYGYCYGNPLKYTDPSGELFIIDDWIIGGIKGLFNGEGFWKSANRHAGNSAKIWCGLYVSDPNKDFLGRVGEVFSRFTWQLPQTIAGFVGAHGTNMIGHVNKVDYAFGATVLQTNTSIYKFGAITLGSYIIGNNEMEAKPENKWFQHEYGHYLQSQDVGLKYLFDYGLPSLLSAAKNDPTYDHGTHSVEQDANKLAYMYFSYSDKNFNQIDENGNLINTKWSYYSNKIIGYNWNYSYKNSNNLTILRDRLTTGMIHPFIIYF